MKPGSLSCGGGYRYYVLGLMCAVVGVYEAMTLSVSFAWVCMVHHNASDPGNLHYTIPEGDPSPYKVDWDKGVQTALFVGGAIAALFVHIPSGWLIDRRGSRLLVFASLLLMAFNSLVTPLVAKWSWWWVVGLRVLTTFAYAPIDAVTYNVCSEWAPSHQLGLALALTFTGFQLGPFCLLLLSGVECDTIGWQWVFYLIGIVAVLMAGLWLLTYANGPDKSAFTSKAEADLILSSRRRSGAAKSGTPWLSILSSGPFWAILVCGLGSLWANIVLRTYTPIFLQEVLAVKPTKNGVYSALPYLAQIFSRLLAGPLSDTGLGCGLRPTTVLKVFNSLSFFGTAVGFVGLSFVRSDSPEWLAVALNIGTMFMLVFFTGGFQKSPLYIAPQHTGVIAAMTYFCATVVAIGEIFFVGWETRHYLDSEWKVVFYVSAAVCAIAGVMFLAFGSAELQSWAKAAEEKEEAVEETGPFKAVIFRPHSTDSRVSLTRYRSWELPSEDFPSQIEDHN